MIFLKFFCGFGQLPLIRPLNLPHEEIFISVSLRPPRKQHALVHVPYERVGVER